MYMIKEIIYSNLEETDKITRTVQRAKLLLVNSKFAVIKNTPLFSIKYYNI